MENILNQAPEGTNIEDVNKLYKKHNGDTVKILSELWEVKEAPIKNIVYDDKYKNEKKWKEIREVCDAYEEEMEKFMSSIKK